MGTTAPEPILTESIRIHPKPTPQAQPTITYLSIVDSTVATLGAATALWVFQTPVEKHRTDRSELKLLSESLSQTLSAYPHFAGQLELTAWPTKGIAEQLERRFRRCFVTNRSTTDPGVELQTADLAIDASTIFPDNQARRTTHTIWDVTGTNMSKLFSPTGEFPVNSLSFRADAPSVLVRVTTLACGSLVIVPRIAHPLADAETMMLFMKTWGQAHRGLRHGRVVSSITCPVSATELNRFASGDVNMPAPQPELIQQSMDLPLPRYDWWEHEQGNPKALDDSAQVRLPVGAPSEVLNSRIRGTRIPWNEWDREAPVSHKVLRLSDAEVESLYQEVTREQRHDQSPVSRHDVLLAFIWQLVAAVKPPKADSGSHGAPTGDVVWLDTTLGLRRRLGLPASTAGSPIMLAGLSSQRSLVVGTCAGLHRPDRASGPGETSTFPDFKALASAARLIREHIAKFDAEAIGAWLHEQAYEIAPQRWWNGFLGSKHTMATSWARAGLWDVDFGFGDDSEGARASSSGGKLRWAGVVGPSLDGLVTLVEAEGGHGRNWWAGGIDIDMKLEANAMARAVDAVTGWRRDQHDA